LFYKRPISIFRPHQRIGHPRGFQVLGLPWKSCWNISYLQWMLHGSPITLDFYYLLTTV
jgi:hypothetical protein